MCHEEDEHEEEDETEAEMPEEIYDSEGNVVWSQYYEGQFVTRACQGCGAAFKGMPDHGYCHTCADIRERGGDLNY